ASSRKKTRTATLEATAAIRRVATWTRLLNSPRETMTASVFRSGPSRVGSFTLAHEGDDDAVRPLVPQKDVPRVAAPRGVIALGGRVGRAHADEAAGLQRREGAHEAEGSLGAEHPAVVHGRHGRLDPGSGALVFAWLHSHQFQTVSN